MILFPLSFPYSKMKGYKLELKFQKFYDKKLCKNYVKRVIKQ